MGNLDLKGKRCLTPPRISKHLERRYRKQWENMNGEKNANLYQRRGQRVWFLNKKQNVLNEDQERLYAENMDNSLISYTPKSSEEEEDEFGIGVDIDRDLDLTAMTQSRLSLIDGDVSNQSNVMMERQSLPRGSELELSSIQETSDDDKDIMDPF